jgi:hypothetical protein
MHSETRFPLACPLILVLLVYLPAPRIQSSVFRFLIRALLKDYVIQIPVMMRNTDNFPACLDKRCHPFGGEWTTANIPL